MRDDHAVLAEGPPEWLRELVRVGVSIGMLLALVLGVIAVLVLGYVPRR